MSYNLSNVAKNASTIHGLIGGVNDELMFGWYGALILIGLSIVLFTSFTLVTGQDTKKSIVGTSFIMAILAVFFSALDWINDTTLFIFIISCALSTAFTYRRS